MYLKQWAVDGKVQTYRLLVPSEEQAHWKKHSLAGIAYREHLYTQIRGGVETDEFERRLHVEFENPAVGPLKRAICDERLSPDDWNALIRFAVAQDVRTPARLKAFLADHQEWLPRMMKETLSETVSQLEAGRKAKSSSTPSDIAQDGLPLKVAVQRNPEGDGILKAEMVLGRSYWLWSLRRILAHTINLVPKYGWTIFRAPPGMSWPTSDNPLVRLNFTDASRYDFGGGWCVRNGDVFLPLSPTHLMFTCIGKKPALRGSQLNPQIAALICKCIIEHADQYVFSKNPFDVHLIRPRVVSQSRYRDEQVAWSTWGRDQRAAEMELLRADADRDV